MNRFETWSARVLRVSVLFLVGCGAATPLPSEPAESDGPQTYAVALRLEDAGTDDEETPHTRVALVRIAPDGARRLDELHVETGACWHDGSPGQTGDTDVLIAARCWWAGAGARYQLVREGDAVVARRRGLDEQAGDAAWEEVGRVDFPAGARLQVLAPGRRAELPEESE